MSFEMLYSTEIRLNPSVTIQVDRGDRVMLDVCGRVTIGGAFCARVEQELISAARSELLDTAVLLDC